MAVSVPNDIDTWDDGDAVVVPPALVWLPLRGDATPAGPCPPVHTEGVTPARNRFGVPQGAVQLDGVRGVIRLDDAVTVRPPALTVAVWYQPRPSLDDRVRWMPLVDRMNAFVPDGYRLHVAEDGVMASVATGPGGTMVELFEAPCQFVSGRWHHLSLTYDGQRLSFHLDGRVVRTKDAEHPGPLWYGTLQTPLGIGARASGPTSRLLGALEDLRVWDRALSAAELEVVRRGG